ncbi:MAG: cytochrome class [Flavipsychrobacter sp.]|nr:cytochrome class [Flavipsychrobacter sp.]
MQLPFRPSTKLLIASLSCATLITAISCRHRAEAPANESISPVESVYRGPDTSTIPHDEFGDAVRYGRELIVNTAYYLGPNGTVAKHLGNKMNCGSCHLDAGTRPYGLNYFSTHARYPQYRGRENRILTLAERVNNCIERPHHGKAMPLDSKEMVAIVSYMKWLSTNVPVGKNIDGDGAAELDYPNRPASIGNGAQVYAMHCVRCHMPDGEGQLKPDSTMYLYPPLWGMGSYDKGSSMHRVLKAARFIKANMPYQQAYWDKPLLTDAEAIDVAAFINDDRIHPRPESQFTPGYPNIEKKPIDYYKPPFADTFSTHQHKFGPYRPIIEYHKATGLPVIF